MLRVGCCEPEEREVDVLSAERAGIPRATSVSLSESREPVGEGMSIQWAVGLVIVGSEDRCVCKTYSKDSLDLTVLISNVRTACTMVHSISTVLEYSCTRPYTYTS